MKKNVRPKSTPQSISGILDALLEQKKLKKRIDDCRAMDLWDAVVGEKIAGRTSPFALKDGVLKVTVSDHGWLQELQFLKEEIKERLNEALGGESIKSLYFKLGPVKEREAPAPPVAEQLKKVKLTDGEKEIIASVVGDIEDRDVREAIKKVLVKEAKRKKLIANQ